MLGITAGCKNVFGLSWSKDAHKGDVPELRIPVIVTADSGAT